MKLTIILLSLFTGSLMAAEQYKDYLVTLPPYGALKAVVLKEIPDADEMFAGIVATRLAGKYKNSEEIAQKLYEAFCQANPDVINMAQNEISSTDFMAFAQRIKKKVQ